MKNNHLPILYMFVSSAKLMKRDWRLMLHLSWPCLLVCVLTVFSGLSFQPQDSLLWSLLNGIIFTLVVVWATVRWLRAILLRQCRHRQQGRALAAQPAVRILGYLLSMMLVGLVCVVAGMLTENDSRWLQLSTELLLMLPLSWIISRWGLAIPATALEDKKQGLHFAWQVSRHYRGALFVLIGMLPAMLAGVLVSIQGVHGAVALLIGLLAYLAWAYEICVLSLSYQWIVQRQAIDKLLKRSQHNVTLR